MAKRTKKPAPPLTEADYIRAKYLENFYAPLANWFTGMLQEVRKRGWSSHYPEAFNGVIGWKDGRFITMQQIIPAYIENGRRGGGGKPPFDAIHNWVICKNIPIPPQFNGDAEAFAWVVQRNIWLHGTKPKQYLTRIYLETAPPNLGNALVDMLDELNLLYKSELVQ